MMSNSIKPTINCTWILQIIRPNPNMWWINKYCIRLRLSALNRSYREKKTIPKSVMEEHIFYTQTRSRTPPRVKDYSSFGLHSAPLMHSCTHALTNISFFLCKLSTTFQKNGPQCNQYEFPATFAEDNRLIQYPTTNKMVEKCWRSSAVHL